LIEHINNRRFANRATLGKYADIEFDTYMELSGGKEDVLHVATRIHYFEKGEGKPIVLLHGALQNIYTWRNNIGDLASEHRVIAADLMGYGFSDCPDLTYSIEEYTLAMGPFLDVIGAEHCDMIAFGQACAYAADFACFNKERVDKIVMINPGPFTATSFPGAKGIVGSFGGTINKYMKAPFMQKALEDSYFDRTLINQEMVDEYCHNFDDPEHRQTMRLSIANFDDSSVITKLEMLEKPILLISSKDDTIANQDDVESYRGVLRNGFGLELRNCGYFAHEEKPEKVDAAILEFLEKK